MENLINIGEFEYRVGKLNAIEFLAMQMQLNDSIDKSVSYFYSILEKFEVKIGESWLPVKQKGTNNFYPAGIENDFETIQALLSFFIKYAKEVFQKSNA